MAGSISSLVAQCLVRLRALVDPPDGIDPNLLDPRVVLQMVDEQSRFKVWSGNIGAHRIGMSSLDYRLRDASHVKSQVINLLNDLLVLVEDASAIARGEQTPWDYHDPGLEEKEIAEAGSYDGSPDTELGQIALDMADVVNCLLRLTVTIRNPAPHDRYVRTQCVEASHFEPFDTQHVCSKFDHIEPWLADRLGKAISRRRQYLKYRQSHHEKLAYGLDQADLGADDTPEAETVASSIPSHLKDDRGGSSQTQTPLPILRDDGSDAGMSQTSYATSIANSNELTIPPFPKEAHSGPVQCCLCYRMIVVKDRVAWKKHVYGDLQPYVCLENDCLTPAREYPRRHEWMEHVRQNHWKTYQCIACQSPFSSFADCRSHLETSHPVNRSEAELDAMVKLSEQSLEIEKGAPCPLCREILNSIQQYQRHVGRHQEQLSLFALPSFDAESEGEAEANEDQGSDESDWENFASDTELALPENRLFKCPYPHCGKTFKRRADRERHFKMQHGADKKPEYFCDYKKCPRHNDPFVRQDHFRDHLREYHGEDVLPRGRKKYGAELSPSRSQVAMSTGWWRCSRCLIRVGIKEHGFVCSGCGAACEKERQKYRMEKGYTADGQN